MADNCLVTRGERSPSTCMPLIAFEQFYSLLGSSPYDAIRTQHEAEPDQGLLNGGHRLDRWLRGIVRLDKRGDGIFRLWPRLARSRAEAYPPHCP